MDKLELEKGFLPIVGTRVFVTGTRHHGFRGEVIAPDPTWSPRAIAVRLDEWPDEVFKFYNHNLIREDMLP
jgi:hypothetical protein